MILAAGQGKRMGALTLSKPKPLLTVKGIPLIEYHLNALAKANILNVVINVHYLKEQMISYLGDGSQYGLSIQYSVEEDCLNTGGGICQALPWLGKEPFLVVSADIWTNYDYAELAHYATKSAHLVMVDNPDFHPEGDFSLEGQSLGLKAAPRLTYGNIALFHPDFFQGAPEGAFPLGLWLREKISQGQVTGEHFSGIWENVGTEAQLNQLELEMENAC